MTRLANGVVVAYALLLIWIVTLTIIIANQA